MGVETNKKTQAKHINLSISCAIASGQNSRITVEGGTPQGGLTVPHLPLTLSAAPGEQSAVLPAGPEHYLCHVEAR
jgi:hypothetical protein